MSRPTGSADAYDLVVVGAGSCGLAAARAGARAGRRTALVEVEPHPGGDCTHYGCVPSKSLLETAKRVAHARSGAEHGFSAQVEVDFGAVMARVHDVIRHVERDESPRLLARQGIDLLTGWARFTGPRTLAVADHEVTASRVVLATGSRALVPEVDGLADVPYLTNRTVFALTEQPRHLLVMGGGPIGCELAQAFARLGSAVTVLQRADRLLPREEPEVATVVRAALEADGVEVRLGAQVTAVEAGPVAVLDDGTRVAGSHLLVAVGRQAATDDLGLEHPGVARTDRGEITVDADLRTTAPHVFAAGDCASLLRFTHVADEQGRLAARNAFRGRRPGWLGGASPFDDRVVPWATFTDPEVGRVGITEAEAYARWGERARVAYLPMSVVDRARTAGETSGFVKLIAAPGPLRVELLDRVVGMTAVAPVGGELVAEAALAMRQRLLAGRLAQTVHAYPTWSLAVRVAAAQLYGEQAGRRARPARPGPPT